MIDDKVIVRRIANLFYTLCAEAAVIIYLFTDLRTH